MTLKIVNAAEVVEAMRSAKARGEKFELDSAGNVVYPSTTYPTRWLESEGMFIEPGEEAYLLLDAVYHPHTVQLCKDRDAVAELREAILAVLELEEIDTKW